MTVNESGAGAYRRGVGILLLNDAGAVWVGRRIDQREESWQMPQGGIDAGETPRQAAFRELKEEIGTDKAEILAESRDWLSYELPPKMRSKVWRGRYRGQKQKWFAMRFLGHDRDIDIAAHHPEFNAWKWIPPDDLIRLIVPFKRELYREIVTEFAPLWRPE
jgi:putative (di)nucleoside polyphosphate hydrolase